MQVLRLPTRQPSCLAAAAHYCYNGVLSRRVSVAYAQHLTAAQAAQNSTRPDGDLDAKGSKPAMAVHVARPSIPCDKPLPLANVLEVQRLLFLLEAPEYCMRAFREHGVNGQDLIALLEEDLEDSRFKFPRHVQRKVMRIPRAWRTFVAITGSHTQPFVSLEQYVGFYGTGRTPEQAAQLQAAFRMVDINSNGLLTFEEFLVGFALLEAAVAEQPRAQPPVDATAAKVPAPAAANTDTRSRKGWF